MKLKKEINLTQLVKEEKDIPYLVDQHLLDKNA